MNALNTTPGRWITVAVLTTLLPVAALALPRADGAHPGVMQQRLELLDRVLRQDVEDGRVPGLVAAVVRDGQIAYLEPMGWQNLEAGIAMPFDGIFQIRSMSKPITALAVMQQLEAGRLSLTDPVSKYIPAFANMQVMDDPADWQNPELRPAARSLTIEDLLLHTGGLSHRFSPLYSSNNVRSRSDTLEQLVEKVAAQPLVADPGEQWNYSISTTVLGRVVEIVSGQRFDHYLAEHVFGPLGMVDTGFHVPNDKRDRQVMAYNVPSNAGGGFEAVPDMTVPIRQEPALFEGAAGLVSTVPDYLRFLQAMLNGGELDGERVLTAESVALLTQNQLDPSLLPLRLGGNALPGLGWGYGFSVVLQPEQSPFAVNRGEFGWNGSLGTFSWVDPETGSIAVLMMQISPSGAWDMSARFKSLVYQALVTVGAAE